MSIGDGCEPYDMDFGDREYREWLERHLTADEIATYDRWLGCLPEYRTGQRWAWRRYRLRCALSPKRWFALWRIRRLAGRAHERGGEPPAPSWKVRMEWGVAARGRDV